MLIQGCEAAKNRGTEDLADAAPGTKLVKNAVSRRPTRSIPVRRGDSAGRSRHPAIVLLSGSGRDTGARALITTEVVAQPDGFLPHAVPAKLVDKAGNVVVVKLRAHEKVPREIHLNTDAGVFLEMVRSSYW